DDWKSKASRHSENQDPLSVIFACANFTDRKTSEFQSSKVGFPIRKSADQSLFATPRGLSQRTTSFIASQRQGIHQMPFRHLIALIVDAHPSAEGFRKTNSFFESGIDAFILSLFREKTSLLRKSSGGCGCRSCSCARIAQAHEKLHSHRIASDANVRTICLFTMS